MSSLLLHLLHHLLFLSVHLHLLGEWFSIQSGLFSRQSHHIGTPVPSPLPGRSSMSHTRASHQWCIFCWRSSRREDVFVDVEKWQDASHSSHQLARWQSVSELLITVSGTYPRIDEPKRDSRVFAIDCPDLQAGPYIYFITRQPVRP